MRIQNSVERILGYCYSSIVLKRAQLTDEYVS